MVFKTGDKKPRNSGRKKGTPNKKSLKLSQELENKGFDLVGEFISIYGQSDVQGKRAMILRALDHVFPRLKALDINEIEKDKPKTIEEIIRELDEKNIGCN